MIVEVARRVRFCVPIGPVRGIGVDDSPPPARHNTFSSWPAMRGVGAFYEIEARCRGSVDPDTGYLLNITAIDEAMRTAALPIVSAAAHGKGGGGVHAILAAIARALRGELGNSLASVCWCLTPYYCLTMDLQSPDRVLISQQFEFAAAHRLHNPAMSDEKNRATFGKCNNPLGHGHNYRLEVQVQTPLEADGAGEPLTVEAIDRIVDEAVIRDFDHRNLNLEVPEFASLNPSVENIARVCHQRLAEPVAAAGGRLARVTVWETEKTRCTYPAEP